MVPHPVAQNAESRPLDSSPGLPGADPHLIGTYRLPASYAGGLLLAQRR